MNSRVFDQAVQEAMTLQSSCLATTLSALYPFCSWVMRAPRDFSPSVERKSPDTGWRGSSPTPLPSQSTVTALALRPEKFRFHKGLLCCAVLRYGVVCCAGVWCAVLCCALVLTVPSSWEPGGPTVSQGGLSGMGVDWVSLSPHS